MSLYIPRMRHDDDSDDFSHLPQLPQATYYDSSLASLRRFPSSSRSSPASDHFMPSSSRTYAVDEKLASLVEQPSYADVVRPQSPTPTSPGSEASRKHTTLKKTRRYSQDSIDEKKRSADDAFWADLARQSNAFKGPRAARPGSPYASRIPTREEIFPSEPMPVSWVRSFGPPPSLPIPQESTPSDWEEFEGPLFPALREESNEPEVPTCTQAIVRRIAELTQRIRYGIYNKQQAFADWLSRRKLSLRCRRPHALPDT